jgi:outer membrane protein assembly factor BamB
MKHHSHSQPSPAPRLMSLAVLILVGGLSLSVGTTFVGSHTGMSVGPSYDSLASFSAALAAGPALATPAQTSGNLTWPTISFDPEHTDANLAERTLNSSNVSELAPLWTFDTPGAVTSSLAVVNGTAYFGDWNGSLYAVNAYTGQLEWQTDLGGPYDYTGCQQDGIAATPTVWNNTVFIGGSNPWEYAVNASTGAILWHVDLANYTATGSPWTAYKAWSSALVADGNLYVGTSSGCDNPLVNASLLQISLTSHSITHFAFTDPAGMIGDSIWSSPSFDPSTDTVWATTGNGYGAELEQYARSIMEFNASNVSQVIGYAQEAAPGHDYDFGDGVTIFHSSTGVPMVVALNKNGYAYAFNVSTFRGNVSADPAWSVEVTTIPGSSYSPPAFDGQLLYFASDNTTLLDGAPANGSVMAVYPNNGSVAWQVGLPLSVYGGLTYANGLILAGLTGGQHDQGAGAFEVLNATDGQSLYYRASDAVWGEPVVLNGEVLFGGGLLSNDSGGTVTALALPLTATISSTTVPGYSEATYRFTAAPAGGVLPYNVSWSISDGGQGYSSTIEHSFAAGGPFRVAVTVRDAAGAEYTTTFGGTASPPLVAMSTVSPDPLSLGGSGWLNVTPSGGLPPYSCNWTGLPPGSNFSNGTPLAVPVRPTSSGEYNVTASVTSSSGQVTILDLPAFWVDGPAQVTIEARPATGSIPLNVSFGVDFGYPNVTGAFAWTFGDGGTSSLAAPAHTYLEPGSYTVTVTVLYPGGSRALATATLAVAGPWGVTLGELGLGGGLAFGALVAVVVVVSRRRPSGRIGPARS